MNKKAKNDCSKIPFLISYSFFF